MGGIMSKWLVLQEYPAAGDARELGEPVRDELIALEHSAQHYN